MAGSGTTVISGAGTTGSGVATTGATSATAAGAASATTGTGLEPFVFKFLEAKLLKFDTDS